MTKKHRDDRAAATAALAGQLKGVPLGEPARELAQRHSTEELREMSRSEAARDAAARRKPESEPG